jgi:hypothetical protein
VRDLAAMQLSNLLRYDDRPKPQWSDEQWTVLRAKVRAALAHK